MHAGRESELFTARDEKDGGARGGEDAIRDVEKSSRAGGSIVDSEREAAEDSIGHQSRCRFS